MKKGLRTAKSRKGLLLSFLTLGLATSLAVLPTQFPSTATVNNQEQASSRTESHVDGLENYDIRTDKKAGQALIEFRARSGKDERSVAAERSEMLAAEQALRQRVPTLKVEYNSDLRTPEIITPDVKLGRSFLTRATAERRSEVLRSFIKTNNDL
ncbi:MAG TPA: hypothetical protein VEX64_07085, partial [Pyrinomonadaceae bacterium]|nr:hypothetical protein [Pyrinomonadaceae bacterium]